MDELVEDESNPGHLIRYYDYLVKHRNIVLSPDPKKFAEVQDAVAQYFLGIDYSNLQVDKMMNSAPRNVRGGSELENFKFSKTLLNILKDLMILGFYHDIGRIPEIFYIASVVLASHRWDNQVAVIQNNSNQEAEIEEEEEEYLLDDDSFNDNNIGSAFKVIKQIREGVFDGEESKDGRSRSNSVGNNLKSLQFHDEPDPSPRISNQFDYTAIMVDENLKLETRTSVHNAEKLVTNNPESRRGPELNRMCTRHDRSKFPEFLRMHIYENQRWFGFSYELEIVLSTRGPFSTSYKDLLLVYNRKHTVEQYPDDPGGLPDVTWKWLDDWTIQTIDKKDPSVEEYMRSEDSDGWFYALDWNYEFSPQKGLTSNVRRRRWERTCREKTAQEFVDDLLEKGFTQQNLLQIMTTNRNISNDGVFDFKKVTHVAP